MLTFQNHCMLAVVDYMLFMKLFVQDANYRLESRRIPQNIMVSVHDSPARRDDYTTVSGSTVFPLNFCTT